jgi:hypothetical protein
MYVETVGLSFGFSGGSISFSFFNKYHEQMTLK